MQPSLSLFNAFKLKAVKLKAQRNNHLSLYGGNVRGAPISRVSLTFEKTLKSLIHGSIISVFNSLAVI